MASNVKTGRCTNGDCVDVQDNEDGTFMFRSTLGPLKGNVLYNADEVAAFLRDVKAGKHDGLLAAAEQYATV